MKNSIVIVGCMLCILLVLAIARNTEKSTPAPRNCQVEIDDLNYQLRQCKMIRGQ